MKKLILAVAILLTMFVAAYALLGNSEEAIRYKIERANHCASTADCVATSFGCPFGCWDYVNKNALEEILADVKTLDGERCVYKCRAPSFNDKFPVCESGKCISTEDSSKIFASYSCDETKVVLENELKYKNYCESDSDCSSAADLGLGCPFSCGVVVSKKFFEGTGYKSLYDAYAKSCGQCEYKCAAPAKIGCVNHSCSVIPN